MVIKNIIDMYSLKTLNNSVIRLNLQFVLVKTMHGLYLLTKLQINKLMSLSHHWYGWWMENFNKNCSKHNCCKRA